MLTFEALEAGFGDAILLRYPRPDGTERIILVDGGPGSASRKGEPNYRPFKASIIPRLAELHAALTAGSAGKTLLLDLVVCTHIDDDHINGIERLFECLVGDVDWPTGHPPLAAPQLWFNSFSPLLGEAIADVAQHLNAVPAAVAASVAQGEKLTSYAARNGTKINDGVPGGLVKCGYRPSGLGEAEITVVAPNDKALADLRRDWLKAIQKKPQLVVGARPAAAAPPWVKPDQAVANLSSIAMLVVLDGKKILLTGDARGDHVLQGLGECGLLDGNGRLHVDVMKVPHHGSQANVLPGFIEAVTADHYVFSSNGKDQNPDPPVLELVAGQASSGRKFTMHFTNGDQAFDPFRDGTLPKLRGQTCDTLATAIGLLKQDAAVAANVTFAFRDRTRPSLQIAL